MSVHLWQTVKYIHIENKTFFHSSWNSLRVPICKNMNLHKDSQFNPNKPIQKYLMFSLLSFLIKFISQNLNKLNSSGYKFICAQSRAPRYDLHNEDSPALLSNWFERSKYRDYSYKPVSLNRQLSVVNLSCNSFSILRLFQTVSTFCTSFIYFRCVESRVVAASVI